MDFDLEGARKAGYSDNEIATFLAQQKGFDLNGALKEGYSAGDVIGFLAGGKEPYSGPIDDTTGAGWQERAILGSAGDNATRFERAKALWGDDAQMDKDGRISFTNPDTGRRTYVNPSGFDMGDIAGAGREIFSTIASLPAAALTSWSGPGALVAGSAAGAAGSQAFDSLAAARARQLAEQRGHQVPKVQDFREAAADTAMEFGAGVAGGKVMQGVGKVIGGALNPMKQGLVDAFKRVGMDIPTVGTGAGGKSSGMFETALSTLPGSSGTMEKAAEAGRTGLYDATKGVAEKIARGRDVASTPEELGAAIKDAATSSGDAFTLGNTRWYDQFTKKWGASPATLANTEAAIEKMTEGLSPEAKQAAQDRMRNLLATEFLDQENGGLNLNTIKAARTRIGEALKPTSKLDTKGVEQGQLHKLYGALTDDYRAAVTDPSAASALARHNAWETGQHSARDLLRSKLGIDTLTGNQIAKKMLSPELSEETVSALQKVLPKSQFDQLRAGVLRNSAMPLASEGFAPGQASATQLSKMLGSGRRGFSPEVQRMLFGKDVDDLRVVSDALANMPRNANTSKTAQQNIMTGLLAGSVPTAFFSPTAAAAAAGSVALPYGLGKATTSRWLIDALAKPQSKASKAVLEKVLPQAGRIGGMLGEFEKE